VSDALSFLPDADARALRSGPDPEAARARLAAAVDRAPRLADPDLAAPLVALCGASRALGAFLLTIGDEAATLIGAPRLAPPAVGRDSFGRDVGGHLLQIAALDLTGALTMPDVGRALSDLADAAVVAALDGLEAPPSVIALGKWGGRELNYASDIDLVFVHDGDATAATAAAGEFLRRMTTRSGDGFSYRVDTDLRPEGASGPLTRSLDSYRAYWERWAGVWELQAMMKARFVAGDPDLGAAFLDAVAPYVFPDTLGGDAVREIRAMKARTEALVGDGELKRGIGGIRDVEFAVQLLQLVHGRSDHALRSANTLDGLRLLGEGGYVAPDDAADFADSYRWLRTVEHRLQLYDLRQTHTLPADPPTRERVAKASGYRDEPDATALASFEAALTTHRARVRRIHEELFYRPLLEAYADVPGDIADRVDRQLAAFGFTDSTAARTALSELTGGLSRRSRAMQQLLPVMLGWLSETPDPDLGLAQLRLLMASTTDQMAPILRDTPAVAERLCLLLGSSRLAARLVNRIPPALPWLGDDATLASDAFALGGAVSRLAVREARPAQIETLHRFHAERLLHTAMADLSGFIDAVGVGHRLAATSDAVVEAALAAASSSARADGHAVPPMAVVAMGKWGGLELNYASDLDGLIVYRDVGDGADAGATRVAESLLSMLARSAVDLPVPVLDLDLRPEGKKGPLARSMASYRAYWSRWAETWERQALIRARPVAGDPSLGAEFADAAREHAFPPHLDDDQVREVRAMKARIEKERIPFDEDPEFHMKLGRGGMSDVEWVVQLLQLRHGDQIEAIRTPSTVEALGRLVHAGLLSAEDASALDAAYRFCATVRNRLYLRAGRARDSLPTDPEEAARLAVSLGYEINPRSALREEYRRVTRRARRVTDRVFYGRA
jgi:glutamate-ammonia-ligase adenylyltransferase